MDIIEYTTSFLVLPSLVFILFYFFQAKLSFKWNEKAAEWLISRGLFYRVGIDRGDEVVINLVRIILGCLFLYRLIVVAEFSLPLDPNGNEVLAIALYFVLLIMFTLGVLTPVVTLLLLVYQLQFNFILKTYTLGVDVTAMVLLCMVLYPVGRILSLDARLFHRVNFLKNVYHWFTYHDRATQIVTAKGLAFYSYCLLCLYSVFLHLDEPLWMNGEVAIHLLSSSYLSKYHTVFQSLFLEYPVAVWLAKFSMIGMLLWYFLLGPAVIAGGAVRKVALLWAVAFFLVSTFLLQLSVLGYVEFLLFFSLFWINLLPKQIQYVSMLYDDKCNLCDKTIKFLRFIDIAKVIKFRPISSNLEKADHVGVLPEELRNDLYSWDEGTYQVYTGYDFYLHISRRLLFLHVLYPVLLVFKWTKIGPAIYRVIAKRRIELFGVCELPLNPQAGIANNIDERNDYSNKTKSFYRPFLLVSACSSLLFISIMPISPIVSYIEKNFPYIARSVHILSWSRISVFNEPDLKMTNHYYTASIRIDGNDVLLPFTNQDGSRLAWHRSDRVYFGNSLRWRRAKNYQEILPPTYRDYGDFCEILMWAKNKGFTYQNGVNLTFYQAAWPLIEGTSVTFFPANIVGELNLSLEKCKLT